MTATRTRTKTRRNEKKVATEKSAETATKTVPSYPGFEIKILHKKALYKLLCCHHGDNIALTYPVLSSEIGIGEKTKAWQCVAWKDLKSGGYIVAGTEPKTFVLSQKGVALATSLATPEELAEFKLPTTNEELHETIRKRLTKGGTAKKQRHSGTKIFDLLLRLESNNKDENNKVEDRSFLRLELASKLGTNPDSHGFYYGFKALEKLKLVSVAGKLSGDEFVNRATEAMANTANNKPNTKTKSKASEKKMAKIEGDDGLGALEKTKVVPSAGNLSKDDPTNISNKNIHKAIKKEKEDDETDDDSKAVESEKSGGEEEEKDEPQSQPQPQPQQRPKRKRGKKEDDTRLAKLEDPSPGKKDPVKKKARIRGGPQLFRLSEKAFLTKSSAATTK